MATTVRVHVDWHPIDEQTPGCALDFPSLAPGVECPTLLVDLRYEFRRSAL